MTFLGHTYIFLISFATRNTLEEAGPQREQTQGGRPDEEGGCPAPDPLGPNFPGRGKHTYSKPNIPTDGKFRTHSDGSNPNNP